MSPSAGAPHLCSKCGSHRTRVTGWSSAEGGTFVRCEACGHMSLIPDDVVNTPGPPKMCPKCGHPQLRAIGASATSSRLHYYRCEACEHLVVHGES